MRQQIRKGKKTDAASELSPFFTCFKYFNRKQYLAMWMLTLEDDKIIHCRHVWERCTVFPYSCMWDYIKAASEDVLFDCHSYEMLKCQ